MHDSLPGRRTQLRADVLRSARAVRATHSVPSSTSQTASHLIAGQTSRHLGSPSAGES